MRQSVSSQHEQSIADTTSRLTLDDFTYDLPPELIAQEPALERTSSRLMVLDRCERKIEHRHFCDLAHYLQKGDVLVVNDTRVIPARLIARRAAGGVVEILLIKPEARQPGVWQAMASPLRKLKNGERLSVQTADSQEEFISVAGFCQAPDGQRRGFIDLGVSAEVHTLLSKIGQAPLPPYILRERAGSKDKSSVRDLERYQTVYASQPGAVAAPTAGLHFTSELLDRLKEKGVHICHITLHVGPGTFKPITSALSEHTVESEAFQIPDDTAKTVNECRQRGGRVVAVGTTSCRTLETAGSSGFLAGVSAASSSLYIKPGHNFAMVDTLITNFHLSRSSLLVLVSAFAGHDFIMSAYHEAILQRYRFYSYGDAMLII